jgi:glycine/D-amino acid oxidase-like deaminating enzyme
MYESGSVNVLKGLAGSASRELREQVNMALSNLAFPCMPYVTSVTGLTSFFFFFGSFLVSPQLRSWDRCHNLFLADEKNYDKEVKLDEEALRAIAEEQERRRAEELLEDEEVRPQYRSRAMVKVD